MAFSGTRWPWSGRWEGVAGLRISLGLQVGLRVRNHHPFQQLPARASRPGALGLHHPGSHLHGPRSLFPLGPLCWCLRGPTVPVEFCGHRGELSSSIFLVESSSAISPHVV